MFLGIETFIDDKKLLAAKIKIAAAKVNTTNRVCINTNTNAIHNALIVFHVQKFVYIYINI